ncbi:MAG TPA: GNAT family N-acetyltransferase [Pirellulales bacterium]|jgi:ribosomal protein S18 acetylase RimI-like enzyme
MSKPSENSLSVSAAVPAETAEALQIVFGRLPTEAQAAQVSEAEAEIARTSRQNHILLLARRGERLVAAVWAQIQAGQVVSLWPPGLLPGETDATATALIDLAMAKAITAGAKLAQSLLDTKDQSQAQALLRCQFEHATDLLYLVCPRAKFPHSLPESKLSFESLAQSKTESVKPSSRKSNTSDAQWARLAAIVQRTYEGTQDCPAVQGARSVDEVLNSYRGIGDYDPARWFIVRQTISGEDIGCLLLAEYREQRNWELVYMGVAPEFRGQEFGLQIVRYAQWLSGQAKLDAGTQTNEQPDTNFIAIERLVLAVDRANSPAVAMYLAAGFEVWDRRSVFLRRFD